MKFANIDNLIANTSNTVAKTKLKGVLESINFKEHHNWSGAKSMKIPVPECAIINISNISAMPISKTQNLKSWFEFWDGNGNYFKKPVILNAQGTSSLSDAKKNISADFCNDFWIGDDSFKMTFGDWVAQDSFHIKAYYQDFLKCMSPVCYELTEQQCQTLPYYKDRTWKKALMTSNRNAALDLRMDTGAKCHPMGFPCIVYLNGEFYGIFAFQLKKHRDNYHMNKSVAEHIHLEGSAGVS